MEGPQAISIRVAPTDCWSCGCLIEIVSAVRIRTGDDWIDCSVADLAEHPALVRQIMDHLPADAEIGALKPRFSRTRNESYLSNGCRHCDAIFGNFHEIGTRHEEREVATIDPGASVEWRQLRDALMASDDGHIH